MAARCGCGGALWLRRSVVVAPVRFGCDGALRRCVVGVMVRCANEVVT